MATWNMSFLYTAINTIQQCNNKYVKTIPKYVLNQWNIYIGGQNCKFPPSPLVESFRILDEDILNVSIRPCLHGFGYEDLINDYKVICNVLLHTFLEDRIVDEDQYFNLLLKIYSLRSNSCLNLLSSYHALFLGDWGHSSLHGWSMSSGVQRWTRYVVPTMNHMFGIILLEQWKALHNNHTR
jgi:hypothetical protein